MSETDWNWCVDELDKFLDISTITGEVKGQMIVDLWEIQQNGMPQMDTRDTKGSVDEINAALPIIQKILSLAGIDKIEYTNNRFGQIEALRAHCIQAKVLILRRQEMEEKLGDTSPKVSAGQLHPWIWESAKSRWKSNHRGSAVEEAGKRLKNELENKANRHLGENEQKLFNTCFGEASTVTWLDLSIDAEQSQRRRAMRGLAEGFYAGIRNRLAHEVDSDLEEAEALQWLAVTSVIARWIDEANFDVKTQ